MVVDENDGNAMDRFIFFDIETMPLETVHRVNLVVAMKVCTLCVGWTNHDGRCEQCEERQMVFSTIDAFCTWLFRPEHQNSIVFAHNFMGYDSYFLLEWLCARGQRPEVVMRGAKCMYMYVKGLNLKFKDSLCFLPMALRKFSKTFNLPEEKGYFPHFFNCPENQNYVGPYPVLEFYGVESMKEEDAEKLRLWHTEQLGDDDGTFPQWMKHREPLNPREGLFGGRTNALKLHFKCPEGSRIDYVDFTSLYPSVMLSGGAYPVGHPTLIRRDFQTPLTEHYYGFNKVKVLPPRHLYIPVLPSHIQNKLMFVLCRTCAEQLRQTEGRCCHNAEERSLVGTWTTPELEKAVALGYVILDVYEVWHYPETSTELFRKYVNTYLRLKQEASGWPAWCHTEEDKHRYVDEYLAHEGILLEHIEANPGLRNLVKLMLNSLWGKFGQNPHLPVTEYVDDPKRFAELMFGPKTEVKHLLLINENLAQLQYDKVDDFTRESGFASVVHAAFVTSFARLKLYRYLEELQERVLYFDTDSIFYVTHPGQALLPLGDYLGDLTSELKRPGDFIREFVSTGPKSYAYVTDQGDKEVKCKGIPLNGMSSAVINFKSMLRLVEGMEEKYVVTEPHRIQRDAKRRQLKTVEMSKDFRVVYDKRVRRGVDTGIRHFVTYSDPKAQIVERFHRTIKNRLWRYFTAQNTQKYVDVLPEFVTGYNQAYHRSIRRSPDSVTFENAQEVWHTLYDDDVKSTTRRRFRFRVGDQVHMSKLARAFKKGYLPNWTEEVFVIASQMQGTPPRYKLNEWDGDPIEGSFYEQELQRVTVRPEDSFRVEAIVKRRRRAGQKEVLV
ncbi:hypothetical protein QZH41_013954 [Actinostola sp. cb2023]|nr:hypothetical protein QZH41_013954 [Actinostola sp. cb2023]